MNKTQTGFLVLVAVFSSFLKVDGQHLEPSKVKELVESKNFVFHAQFANPQGGRNIALTSSYDFTVRPDSIIASLPYFGRAYVAPMSPSEAGVKFTSTKFSFVAKADKKKRWNIHIRPDDNSDFQSLNLTIFDNGNASLTVISTNRRVISYTGYIVEGRPVNKRGF